MRTLQEGETGPDVAELGGAGIPDGRGGRAVHELIRAGA